MLRAGSSLLEDSSCPSSLDVTGLLSLECDRPCEHGPLTSSPGSLCCTWWLLPVNLRPALASPFLPEPCWGPLTASIRPVEGALRAGPVGHRVLVRFLKEAEPVWGTFSPDLLFRLPSQYHALQEAFGSVPWSTRCWPGRCLRVLQRVPESSERNPNQRRTVLRHSLAF